MNEEELKRLLEKYYKGESTENEELILRDYFNARNIPDDYEAEKAIFSFFAAPVKVPEPSSSFESRIQAGVDTAAHKDGQQKIRRHILPYLSVAASLLILVASYYFFLNRGAPPDTFTDPELAYAETMKILMEVSSKLNQGTQALEPVAKINTMTAKSLETFNKSTVIIEKNLKNLDYLRKAIEISNMTEDK